MSAKHEDTPDKLWKKSEKSKNQKVCDDKSEGSVTYGNRKYKVATRWK